MHQALVISGLLCQGVVDSGKLCAEPALECVKRDTRQTLIVHVDSTVALIIIRAEHDVYRQHQ